MDSIEALAEAYAAAVYSKDEAAFLSLYAEDVFVFDMWGPWSYQGREAWAAMVRDWFGSLGEERVRVSFAPDYSVVEDERALWCASVRYAGVAASGEELRWLENRVTWSLRREDGRWRIAHEHSSAPADFNTQKVRLRRE